ncbi:MAG: thiamine-phosphate kinase [Betaproteobacteria bacterium]|nr:thiamine-phosphate kinase [Betaproteobacteria bacterium]
MGEFDLIARYFKRPVRRAALGGGDDCALLQASPGCQIAISCDMLVQGRHFFADADPFKLGHKALAVNLSDLAACGSRPLAFLLALALPTANEVWLAPFSRGLMALADAHECELIGGDTTQGPLNICITVLGEVPLAGARSTALLRSGARAGDELFVSGTLGDARLALMASRGLALPPGLLAKAKQRLDAPTPRVALGLALRGLATAAIDISDGLLGDLAHLLEASAVGACLDTSVAATLMACSSAELDAAVDAETRLECILGGGDDYELLFTAPPAARDAVEQAALASATRVTRIGQIQAEPGLRLFDAKGAPVAARYRSFDHFA